jgi:heme exporter protein B
MLKALFIFIKHELLITQRHALNWLTPLLFFIIVVCCFPLALGPDPILLKKVAPSIIWVAALLSILLSIGHIFQTDADEGYLDLLLLSPYPLTLLVLAKIIAHWLSYGLPLIIVSPILGLLLNLSWQEEFILVLTLFLGTPVFSLLGAIGAALTVNIRGNGLLLPILIMPLYIPVLIFGTSAMAAVNMQQMPLNAYIAMMVALILLSLAFAPLLTGLALRLGDNPS